MLATTIVQATAQLNGLCCSFDREKERQKLDRKVAIYTLACCEY